LFVASRYKSLNFIEFQDELLSYELLLDSHHFAMFSSKPNAHNLNRKPKASGKHYSRPFSIPKPTSYPPKYQPTSSSIPTSKTPCQICGKLSRKALDCFHQASDNGPWFADSAGNQ
jgi:hypothetical protein